MRRYPTRRQFLYSSAGLAAGLSLFPLACSDAPDPTSAPAAAVPEADPLYRISLAQWSLHRSFWGDTLEKMEGNWNAFGEMLHSDQYRSMLAGPLDPLDFARIAREDYGVEAVEYVNTFFFDRARDKAYLQQLKDNAAAAGVQSLLIMCDAEGLLGHPEADARAQAVENHHKWVEAAAFLGCHAIRVNAGSDATLSPEEQQTLAADGLRQLAEYADPFEIDVIVENHGGLSSNGAWLAGVMKAADHPRVGTLPDFGNFLIEGDTWYDRYQGVTELMPYAKAVSAKANAFDAEGNCVETDFHRMMKIVTDAGYRGFVGIEYEGATMSEPDGIRATKALLERVRTDLSPQPA